MSDLYSLFFHYHPLFFFFHHWHAWKLLFSALYFPVHAFMTAWTNTWQTLCSREQHYSLQEQTRPFKPKPETAFLPRYSSHGIEQVLQELDFKTSSIQPHMQQQYSKWHCFNDSVRMGVWNKHFGSKGTFHVILQPLEELYSFAYMHNRVCSGLVWCTTERLDFLENEEKQQWLSRGVIVCKKSSLDAHRNAQTHLWMQ